MVDDLPPDRPGAQLDAEVRRLRARVEQLETSGGPFGPAVQAIAESSADNIMLLDLEGRIRFINRTVPDLTIEQVLGTPVYDYVPPAYHQAIRDALQRVAETGQPDGYDTTYVAEDGSISYWESRVGPMVEGGAVTAYSVISRNATERRKVDADRDRFFNLSLDMLCVATFEGYFQRINPAFTRVLGYSEAELLGSPFASFIHDDDRVRTRRAVSRLEAGQSVIDFENRYRASNGDYRWISWRAVSEPREGRIYAAGRDVTEQRQLQDQVRHAQKLDAIGQLAGGIAHDFNNLVLAIDVNADFALKRSGDSAAVHKHVEQIKAAGARAAELTRQLLAFSRQQRLEPEPLDLARMTHDVTTLIARLIPENIAVETVMHDSGCVTEGDRALLEQVLFNLCLNARDAMPNGGRLTIETSLRRIDAHYCETHPWARPGRYVLWRVTDNGVGMSPKVMERVFEPFFTTKAQGQGTGLGLATSYGIVQQHRGLLHVTSEINRGTCFEVYLPASDRVIVDDAMTPTHALGGTETILVAEDDAMVRRVVIELLEEAGYTVIAARDGVEAVAAFRGNEQRVDMLLLDIVMPRKSGPEALEEIRKLKPGVRAVICSGYGGESEAAQSAVLRKPYDPQTLLTRIRRELDR